MSATSDVRKGTSYEFRRYRPGDEGDFLDLFARTYGEDRDREWFRWRYERTPYLDHVPMFVAACDDGVVGVRPYLPFRMSVGGEPAVALLTADTMVHPDHRRRGLFTTLTEQSLSFYAERDPAFAFNQPNAASRPGYLDLGWRELDRMTTYYRVQDPEPLLAARADGPLTGPLARLAAGVAEGLLEVRDRLTASADRDVVRRPGVAADALASLYRSRVPDAVHALRDESFYRWRFASPEWSRTTYLAGRDGEPTAGAVARTRTNEEGVTITQLADIVPLDGGAAWRDAVRALVEQVLADADDADVVAAPGRSFPGGVAAEFGFLPDDRLPLSKAADTDCVLCVRELGDGLTVGGVDLTDPANWRLTFAERDTA